MMLIPTAHSVPTTPLLIIIITLLKFLLNRFRLYILGHFSVFVPKGNIFIK